MFACRRTFAIFLQMFLSEWEEERPFEIVPNVEALSTRASTRRRRDDGHEAIWRTRSSTSSSNRLILPGHCHLCVTAFFEVSHRIDRSKRLDTLNGRLATCREGYMQSRLVPSFWIVDRREECQPLRARISAMFSLKDQTSRGSSSAYCTQAPVGHASDN